MRYTINFEKIHTKQEATWEATFLYVFHKGNDSSRINHIRSYNMAVRCVFCILFCDYFFFAYINATVVKSACGTFLFNFINLSILCFKALLELVITK